MAERQSFRGESLVEAVEVELGALEPGPGVLEMVGAVDLAVRSASSPFSRS